MRHVPDIYISKRISDLLQKRRFQGLDKIFGKSSSTGVLPLRSLRQRVLEVIRRLSSAAAFGVNSAARQPRVSTVSPFSA
jgi:hypothetical protein